MKKIVLMMLVAMIPFLTMAQKRSKKGKNTKVEKVVQSKSNVEFMVIKGIEYPRKSKQSNEEEILLSEETKGLAREEILLLQKKIRQDLNPIYIITFDFGNKSSKGSRELLEESVHYSSMATAAYSAIEKGWEFMSANVIQGSGSVTHYYYMKRNKK
ncbi:MAG: hypothetical protein HN535_02950 [Flavobacteriales bacterium]|nr:hypothetical protein [Flavobacteriales bacterium]